MGPPLIRKRILQSIQLYFATSNQTKEREARKVARVASLPYDYREAALFSCGFDRSEKSAKGLPQAV
jgi:hypothetical protein